MDAGTASFQVDRVGKDVWNGFPVVVSFPALYLKKENVA